MTALWTAIEYNDGEIEQKRSQVLRVLAPVTQS